MQSQARKESIARHVAKLDLIKIQPYREEGMVIRDSAAEAGQSVQAYVLQAVKERMQRDNGENPVGNIRTEGAAFLSPDTLERARASAEENGEDISRFIGRAVESAIERPAGEVTLSLPPMILELAQARADAAGESLQSYFIRALQERMRREKDAEE